MSQRIHDCLDGRIPRSALRPDERRRLDEFERVVDEGLAHVVESPAPDVVSLVMAKVRATQAEPVPVAARASATAPGLHWLGQALAWLWAPRPIRLRPAFGLAALAVLALGVGTASAGLQSLAVDGEGGSGEESQGASMAASTVEPPASSLPVLYVRFELDAAASSVHVAGTFTDWKPEVALVEHAPGQWTALVPLTPGVHDYAFVVDGKRWVVDPDAMSVRDGFGGVNSRIALVVPEA